MRRMVGILCIAAGLALAAAPQRVPVRVAQRHATQGDTCIDIVFGWDGAKILAFEEILELALGQVYAPAVARLIAETITAQVFWWELRACLTI